MFAVRYFGINPVRAAGTFASLKNQILIVMKVSVESAWRSAVIRFKSEYQVSSFLPLTSIIR
jgi:hypothetical protein